ncbi:MAG: hypothetical protein EZS28_031363 [Streblomastix strix]|uniref:Uncharacterized protein n=1 Tax=Streblomastix strix TaxID=222440 RepID=A0A5J4USJ5_9EUKA|nr:MAG: hypothetical protein EZS28_031363 [Streblomastix strix]
MSPDGQRKARREFLANTAMNRDDDKTKERTLERLAEKEGILRLFAQSDDHIPRQAFIDDDGFTRNNYCGVANEFNKSDYADRDFMTSPVSPGASLLPAIKLEIKKKNPIQTENDFKGPSRLSTTYNTYHNEKILERAPHIRPANEYDQGIDLDIGPQEPSGFTHSVVELYEHRAVPKEMVAVEPSKEFVQHLKKLPHVAERRNKKTNPLVDDSAYYEKHPTQEKNFSSKPPTINKISYQNPPQFDGTEAVPRSVFIDESGYGVNYPPTLGRSLGSGAIEYDNGLGHEVEGVTPQSVKVVREKSPMEYEYLRLGPKLQSVYQVSYIDHHSPHRPGAITKPSQTARKLDDYDREREMMKLTPASTREFTSTINEGRVVPQGGKGVNIFGGDTRQLTVSERENIVGTLRDRHSGLGEGRSVTNEFKEETGFTHNVLPVHSKIRWKPEPQYLSPEQQEKALVSKKLEYEGDVPTTIYKSDYVSPDDQKRQRREFLASTAIGREQDRSKDETSKRLASKEGILRMYSLPDSHIPANVFMSKSGFTRSSEFQGFLQQNQ